MSAKNNNNKASNSIKTQLLDAILRHAPILISAKDADGNVLLVSQQFAELDGPKPSDYINKTVFDLFPKEIARKLHKNDLRAQQSSKPIVSEEEVYHADGSRHIYQSYKFRLVDDEDNLIGTCGVSIDITHLKNMEHQAQHDPLTELLNRRYLDSCFSNELKRARRAKEYLMFVLLDLDGFKQFNDSLGHLKGDELLEDFSRELKKHFQRPSDFCFRLGGDEFAVIFLTDDKQKGIDQVKLLTTDVATRWQQRYDQVCTISAGVRIIGAEGRFTSKRAYRQADEALYEAKELGKDRVEIFQQEPS